MPVLSCLHCFWLCATLWTVACQAPLSMGFSRQEYWSRLPFPYVYLHWLAGPLPLAPPECIHTHTHTHPIERCCSHEGWNIGNWGHCRASSVPHAILERQLCLDLAHFCMSSEQRYQWFLFWTIEDACIVKTLGRLREDLHPGHRTGLFPEQNNKDNISP